ncbi:hypothetical protein EK904_006175 [Melospiza melodia maxima]|nr:hypothetical protein EK904_006175 [Melospiza melodia maxima]
MGLQPSVPSSNRHPKRYESHPICGELQDKILQCYREHAQETLSCSALASQYLNCVNHAKQNAWERRIKALSESSTRPSTNFSRRAFFCFPPQERPSSPFSGQPNKGKKWKSHLKGSRLRAQSAGALGKPGLDLLPSELARAGPRQSPLIAD